jgi:hypothetical protein
MKFKDLKEGMKIFLGRNHKDVGVIPNGIYEVRELFGGRRCHIKNITDGDEYSLWHYRITDGEYYIKLYEETLSYEKEQNREVELVVGDPENCTESSIELGEGLPLEYKEDKELSLQLELETLIKRGVKEIGEGDFARLCEYVLSKHNVDVEIY